MLLYMNTHHNHKDIISKSKSLDKAVSILLYFNKRIKKSNSSCLEYILTGEVPS